MNVKREPTRAEIARQRSAQRAAKELEQTGMRALKPVMPITSRVSRTPVVLSQPKPVGGKTLRRFNASIGLHAFHMHKPSITVSRLRSEWRIVSLFIAILIGTVIYLALTQSYFRVPNITLLGNNRLSREEVEAVLGVAGQSIFIIQPDILETRLRMSYPELASLQVNAYLPNHVYVTVTERQPVILWQQNDGFTWIDSTGVAFRPNGQASGLVHVIGLAAPPAGTISPADQFGPPPYVQKELVNAIINLAPHVPGGVTMVFDSTDGLGWTDSRGWKAFFGTSAQDMPLKISVYNSLVDSLISRSLFPEYINVVYPDGPYYRMAEVGITDLAQENGQQ